MALSKEEFKRKIQSELDTRHLADHPLVLAVAGGKVSRDQLARFAGYWYQAIKEAPRFLAGIMANCPDPKVRRRLLENLLEEETELAGGSASHPELMLRFCQVLGHDPQEIANAAPLPESDSFWRWTLDVCLSNPYQIGVAATGLAHEYYFPDTYRKIVRSLKENYRMSDEEMEFWLVHIEGDEGHSGTALDIVANYATSDELQGKVLWALRESRRRMFEAFDAYARSCGVPVQ